MSDSNDRAQNNDTAPAPNSPQIHPGTAEVKDGDGELKAIVHAWSIHEFWCQLDGWQMARPGKLHGATRDIEFVVIDRNEGLDDNMDAFKNFCKTRFCAIPDNHGKTLSLRFTKWDQAVEAPETHTCPTP